MPAAACVAVLVYETRQASLTVGRLAAAAFIIGVRGTAPATLAASACSRGIDGANDTLGGGAGAGAGDSGA